MQVSAEAERGLQTPGAGATGDCEPHMWVLGTEPGPPQEQCAVFAGLSSPCPSVRDCKPCGTDALPVPFAGCWHSPALVL